MIDSLYHGYPTGYIITWKNPDVKTKDGGHSNGKKVLIDGQQRITALMAAISGKEVLDDDFNKDRIKNPLYQRGQTFYLYPNKALDEIYSYSLSLKGQMEFWNKHQLPQDAFPPLVNRKGRMEIHPHGCPGGTKAHRKTIIKDKSGKLKNSSYPQRRKGSYAS